MNEGYVYILGNSTINVLYTGVTSDLCVRVYEHKFKNGSKFTSKYKCNRLLAFEYFESVEDAIVKEKVIKNWKRPLKLKWIFSQNPRFIDLYDSVVDGSFEYVPPILGKYLSNDIIVDKWLNKE